MAPKSEPPVSRKGYCPRAKARELKFERFGRVSAQDGVDILGRKV